MHLKLASRLHRNRCGIYGYRLVIPKNMRLLFPQSEYRYSLKTANMVEAKRRAYRCGAIVQSHFAKIRAAMKFEEALQQASQLLQSMDVVEFNDETAFLEGLLPIADDATQKQLLQQMIQMRKRTQELEAQKAAIMRKITEQLAELPDDQTDSFFLDLYAQATPIKAEEAELTQQFNAIAIKLQSIYYEQQHATELTEVTARLNADKEQLADFVASIITKSAGTMPSPASQQRDMLLSDVVKEYNLSQNAESKWTEKSAATVDAIFALWLRIVGDQAIGNYGFEQHRHYKTILQRLPPNINKSPAYRGKSIEQILALEGTPATPHTINKNLTRISAFFEWCIRYGYVTTNPARGMTIKNPKRANEERKAFSDDDLARIFGSAIYLRGDFRQPYQYWLPILALFTGCRLNELCQLHLSDFDVVDGIEVIKINEDGDGKRLKTKAGNRIIPIHATLKRIGLLDYVATLRKRREQRLFPELKLRRDGYGQTASKWFARYCTSIGIVESGKVFHSFRHNVVDFLKQVGVAKEKIAALVGHEDESVTFGRYGKDFSVPVMADVVGNLNFQITITPSPRINARKRAITD